ncbi:MAG: DUF47 family protein [Planctomycetes bacterium]|nr:DUF47 family protein [Planctomycetota bacterium]
MLALSFNWTVIVVIIVAVEAACFFREVTAQDYVTAEMLDRMAQIEHRGDNAAHTIIQRLNKTFLTPFDRQDLHPGQTGMNRRRA